MVENQEGYEIQIQSVNGWKRSEQLNPKDGLFSTLNDMFKYLHLKGGNTLSRANYRIVHLKPQEVTKTEMQIWTSIS